MAPVADISEVPEMHPGLEASRLRGRFSGGGIAVADDGASGRDFVVL